jgi:predicted RNA-binding protein Jag
VRLPADPSGEPEGVEPVGASVGLNSFGDHAAVVIGRRGRTRIKALQSLLSALTTSPVKMAGVLMNEH